jgi:hypothetical protein
MRTVCEQDDIGAGSEDAHRGRSTRPLARLLQVLVAGTVVAGLSLAARSGASAPTVPPAEVSIGAAYGPASAQAVRPALPLAQTAPRFRLDDPEAIEAPRAESARRNPTSGHREDILVQGGFDTIEAPYLRLILTEASESEASPGLFITLARRAADGQALAVIRTGERGTIETKFGPMETLEVTLGGEGKRTCTGFASLTRGTLRLDGWLCAPLGQAPEPRAVTCLLDKVALNGQAWPEMSAAFAAIESRRDPGCGPRAAVPTRDFGGETGSLPDRGTRKNEAKLRRSREARP